MCLAGSQYIKHTQMKYLFLKSCLTMFSFHPGPAFITCHLPGRLPRIVMIRPEAYLSRPQPRLIAGCLVVIWCLGLFIPCRDRVGAQSGAVGSPPARGIFKSEGCSPGGVGRTPDRALAVLTRDRRVEIRSPNPTTAPMSAPSVDISRAEEQLVLLSLTRSLSELVSHILTSPGPSSCDTDRPPQGPAGPSPAKCCGLAPRLGLSLLVRYSNGL